MGDVPQPGTEGIADHFKIPVGLDFLKLVRKLDQECEESFDDWIPEAGQKAPQTLEALGTALSYLDRIASCWWGCDGGDHQRERLLGRAVSNSRAALILLKSGYYDEALGVVRQMGELTNLLWLFMLSEEAFLEWKTATEDERRKFFKPVDVRMRIETLEAPQPMDQHLYRKLSGLSTHVEPATNPQGHNVFEIPTLGGFFQDTGALVALNHLSQLVMVALLYGATLLADREDKSVVLEAARTLGESIGGANLDSIGEHWSQIRLTPEFRAMEAQPMRQQKDRRAAFANHDTLTDTDERRTGDRG